MHYNTEGVTNVTHRHVGMSALIALLALFVMAGIASAHTPKVSLTCDGGASVKLTNYNASGDNVNHVTINLDGDILVDEDFENSFSWSDTPDLYEGHHLIVSVTAWDDPNGSHGWTTFYDIAKEACLEATPEPTPTPTPEATPTPTPNESQPPRESKPPKTPTPTLPPTDTVEGDSGTGSTPLVALSIVLLVMAAINTAAVSIGILRTRNNK